MTMTFVGSIAVTISNGFRGAITKESTDEVLILDDAATPILRIYSLTTAAVVKTINLTASLQVRSICLLGSGASALIGGVNTGTLTLVDLTTDHKTTHSGGTAVYAQNINNHLCATDSVNGVSFFVTGQNSLLTKFTHNTWTTSNLTLTGLANRSVQGSGLGTTSIIFIGNGRFLVGTSQGSIAEIDGSGTIYKIAYLDRSPKVDVNDVSTTNLVLTMVYDNGMLLVQTNSGEFVLLDWSATEVKTLQSWPISKSADWFVSTSYEGVVVTNADEFDSALITNNVIQEMDFTTFPLKCDEVLFTGNANAFYSCGVNTTNNKWWSVQGVSGYRLLYGGITPRATTTVTVNMPIPGVDGELILLEDSGVGTARVILSTWSGASRTLRVPAGIDIIQLTKQGEGVDATWGMSRYST